MFSTIYFRTATNLFVALNISLKISHCGPFTWWQNENAQTYDAAM